MRSRQLRNLYAHGLTGAVPASATAIGILALIVAAMAGLVWPTALREHLALVWSLALVPCLLLAYYKGWRGVTVATAATMALVMVSHALLTAWLRTTIDWRMLGIAALAFFSLSLGIAVLSQLGRKGSVDEQAAYADAETGLPNRRILDLFLMRYMAAARRGQELAAVAFEIDNLEEYRGRRGRGAALKAQAAVASILDSNTRVAEVSGRYDRKLFVSLLPHTGPGGAFTFALRVRKAVESAARLKGTGITISAGVSAFSHEMDRNADLIDAAREALQAAIGAGRNRVMVCVSTPAGTRVGATADSAADAPTAAAASVRAPSNRTSRPASSGATGRSKFTSTSLIAIARRKRRW